MVCDGLRQQFKESIGEIREVTVPSSMDEIERQAIEATLDYTKGDKTHAARALGIGRKTLYRKLDQYNGGGENSEE